ncbi:uncharacterized protein [Linepithema humile]|uniref:uncharacterized protein isoform X2 n=1 Tax=Linepithema humile TaxID=83485 RepID=UPI00351ED543
MSRMCITKDELTQVYACKDHSSRGCVVQCDLKIKMQQVKDLSVHELGQKIEELTDAETRHIFNDEKIEGSSFLLLNENDLKSMGLKMGPVKKIFKFIQDCSSSQQIQPSQVDGTYEVAENGEIIFSSDLPMELETSIKMNVESPSSSSNASSSISAISSKNKESTISKNNFSRFKTIHETLLKHPQGTNILKAINGIFTEDDRRSLVRILTSELVKVHGDNYYPPEEAKIALAENIVKEFPKLRDYEAKKGHELYYDSVTKRGFIEYRLWTMRKHISPTKKKYIQAAMKRRNVNKILFSEENSDEEHNGLLPENLYKEKISWMKFKMPSNANKSSISECMSITMNNRRKWIMENAVSIDEICDEFPRLTDYSGEMFDEEFERLYKGASDKFLARFAPFYVQRILIYCSTARPDLFKKSAFIQDDTLRAITLLADLLPVSNAVRKGKRKRKGASKENLSKGKNIIDKKEHGEMYTATFPNPSLLQIWPEGTNIEAQTEKLRSESKGPIQPYIILIKGQSTQYFIQADNRTLTLNNNSPIMALDLLFKTYYVFDVKCPETLIYFFNFLENYCFKISDKVQHALVSSVHINICNITVDNIA